MSMNLDTALGVLEAVLKVCAELPGTAPRATGVPWVFPAMGSGTLSNGDTGTNTRALLTYDVISIAGLGNDEFRQTYDPDLVIPGDLYAGPGAPLGGVVTGVSGNRLITVQVKCEVHGAGRAGAHVYLERVRTKLMLPSVGDALEAVGLAVNDIKDSRPADYRDDSGRIVKCGILEIVFNAADSFDNDPTTTIETTEQDPFVALPP